jgi:hypothetical protein
VLIAGHTSVERNSTGTLTWRKAENEEYGEGMKIEHCRWVNGRTL